MLDKITVKELMYQKKDFGVINFRESDKLSDRVNTIILEGGYSVWM